MASSSACENTDRSVPLGKYCRSRPLVFSLEPRCQGLCGSQKYTAMLADWPTIRKGTETDARRLCAGAAALALDRLLGGQRLKPPVNWTRRVGDHLNIGLVNASWRSQLASVSTKLSDPDIVRPGARQSAFFSETALEQEN